MSFINRLMKKKENSQSLDLPPIPNLESDIPPPPEFSEPASEAYVAPEPIIKEEAPQPIEEPPAIESPEIVKEEIPDPIEGIKSRKEEIMESNEPLFVKIDDYKDLLSTTNTIKTTLSDCDETLKRLNEVKLEEDREYERWKSLLQDIYRKIAYVDKMFFKE